MGLLQGGIVEYHSIFVITVYGSTFSSNLTSVPHCQRLIMVCMLFLRTIMIIVNLSQLPHETETETGYLGKLISDIFQTIDRGTIPEMESGTALKALS